MPLDATSCANSLSLFRRSAAIVPARSHSGSRAAPTRRDACSGAAHELAELSAWFRGAPYPGCACHNDDFRHTSFPIAARSIGSGVALPSWRSLKPGKSRVEDLRHRLRAVWRGE